jgi:hypothetical protein
MYKTINGWTKEKMIEQIIKKNNGTQSFDIEDDYCMYRSNGNACAVGCFIPDELYSKDMEGKTCGAIFFRYPTLGSKMPLKGTVMRELQDEHDYCLRDENVRDRMISWINKNVQD